MFVPTRNSVMVAALSHADPALTNWNFIRAPTEYIKGPRGLPINRPSPLVTKTLLFLAEAGNLSGDPGGPMFRAYDKRTGAVVAEIELPSKATGAPMTYLREGRQ